MALIVPFLLVLFFYAGMLPVRMARDTERIELLSMGLALGAMAAVAVFDLIPDIWESRTAAGSLWLPPLFVLLGLGALKLLDAFIPEHGDSHDAGNLVHIGMMTAVAISLHNILEGMTVYSIASQSMSGGIVLGIGIGLHNIPMGMLMASTLQHGSRGKRIAVLGTAGLSTFIGGCLMALLQSIISEAAVTLLLCAALGMVLYILLLELLPSVFAAKNRQSWLCAAAGFVIVSASCLFLG